MNLPLRATLQVATLASLMPPAHFLVDNLYCFSSPAMVASDAMSVGSGFYPSGCGGHKNLENVATFSQFLGGRKNPDPARSHRDAGV